MGFFSALCLGCGHPALCPAATESKNAWMSDCITMIKGRKTTIEGRYDGYGRLGGISIASPLFNDHVSLWHDKCWEIAGKPGHFTEPSPNAPDQGWFFDHGTHDINPPQNAEDMARIKKAIQKYEKKAYGL